MKSGGNAQMKCLACGTPVIEKMATPQDPYRYDLSGLKDAYLVGITIQFCPECKVQSPIIPRMLELHNVIARSIASVPELLCGDELRFLRKWAELPAKQFAALLGIDASHLSRVENGKTKHLSSPVDKLARAVAMAANEREFTKNILLNIANLRIQQAKRVRAPGKTRPAFALVRNRWKREVA
jgi:DNA-binding transcriptional regulator YiaG